MDKYGAELLASIFYHAEKLKIKKEELEHSTEMEMLKYDELKDQVEEFLKVYEKKSDKLEEKRMTEENAAHLEEILSSHLEVRQKDRTSAPHNPEGSFETASDKSGRKK